MNTPTTEDTSPPNPAHSDTSDGQKVTDAEPSRPSPRLSRSLVTRKSFQMMGATLGFIIGCVAGTYGEELLVRSNPDFFGPDNQQIIDDQHANFDALDAKLTELKLNTANDPRSTALLNELSSLLQEQKNLSKKKNELFRAADVAQQTFKMQLLEKRGVSGAVDFWINQDETMLLKDPDIAMSVLRFWASDNEVDINVAGEKVRMKLGDTLPIQTGEGQMTLIYRHAARDSDGRIGFDLVPASRCPNRLSRSFFIPVLIRIGLTLPDRTIPDGRRTRAATAR